MTEERQPVQAPYAPEAMQLWAYEAWLCNRITRDESKDKKLRKAAKKRASLLWELQRAGSAVDGVRRLKSKKDC